MPDFAVLRKPDESQAVHACRYVLTRVCKDADFAHYMIGTGALEACVAGYCEATGLEPEFVNSQIAEEVKKLPKPEVKELRSEVSQLEDRAWIAENARTDVQEDLHARKSANTKALHQIEELAWDAWVRDESPDPDELYRIIDDRYGAVA